MTISKRVLTKWRKEALVYKELIQRHDKTELSTSIQIEFAKRILQLTQELIDQHLMEEK
jgi:hypothetical protein